MPLYYCKTTEKGYYDEEILYSFGKKIYEYSDDRKREVGLYPAVEIEVGYNPYTHRSCNSWHYYDSIGEIDSVSDNVIYSYFENQPSSPGFPLYVNYCGGTPLDSAAAAVKLKEAKRVVFKETAVRLSVLAGASIAATKLGYTLSDSADSDYAVTLSNHFVASDSAIVDLAYGLEIDSGWGNLPTNYLNDSV